ncbi:zinc finger domain-containing protein [Shinella sumterensis]|uniref:zinc finger domain-containing protein n=1 Tax=Shinella sumterensis TaxID=1967501 RepID=UPI003F82251A
MRFSCSRCGQRWPDHPVTRVPCPTCHVKEGRWCRRPSGHRAAELHIDREHAALAAGVLRICRPASSGKAQQSLNS